MKRKMIKKLGRKMIKKLGHWISKSRTIMRRTIPLAPKGWVFEYWFTVLRYGFFWIGVWQLDILVAPLVFLVRDERFYFLYGSLSYWEAYPLFFAVLAIGFFMIEIVVLYKWFQRKLRKYRK